MPPDPENALRNHEVLSIAGLRRTISARDEALANMPGWASR